uniref:Uncharacterized protein n=1 Tax=Tetranychus urticae TaxID=32264 RepID=A0A158P4J5_TETUR
MINTWFGLTIICLFINSIIGQQLTNDYLINLDESTNSDQSDLKRTPFDNNKINEKTVNKGDLSPLNGQSNANVIKKPGNGQLIGKLDDKGSTVNGTSESTHLEESKDSKDKTGVYKSLDEILNLAGLANAEFLVPSSDPKSFMIKTRIKTSETSEKEEEEDEEDEDEEKGDDEEEDDDDDDEDEKKETTVKKTKKSTGKKSKKSSKKSRNVAVVDDNHGDLLVTLTPNQFN